MNAFFFHYNKPASKQAGRPQISIHYKNACHIVDNLACFVNTVGRVRNRQPYFVMTGKATSLKIHNNRMAVLS